MRPSVDSARLAVVGVRLAPVVVLFLLCWGPLIDFLVVAVGFDLPLVVNDGLVLRRLGLRRLAFGLGGLGGLATGGHNRSRQCGGE